MGLGDTGGSLAFARSISAITWHAAMSTGIDPKSACSFIVVDEVRSGAAPYRYVRDGFSGIDTRFSY